MDSNRDCDYRNRVFDYELTYQIVRPSFVKCSGANNRHIIGHYGNMYDDLFDDWIFLKAKQIIEQTFRTSHPLVYF